jgi:hypothetical protein
VSPNVVPVEGVGVQVSLSPSSVAVLGAWAMGVVVSSFMFGETLGSPVAFRSSMRGV